MNYLYFNHILVQDKLLPNYYRIHKGNNRYNYFSILTNFKLRKKNMMNEKYPMIQLNQDLFKKYLILL